MAPFDYSIKTGATEVATRLGSIIKGKTILITGTNPNGLGAAFAKAVASQDPEIIILTYRTVAEAKEVQKDLLRNFPSVKVILVELDLADFESVREAAKTIEKTTDHVDILINNAGIMAVQERVLTKHGIESQFSTNYIGHFLFTNLIMDLVIVAAKRNEPGSIRIINLAASWHSFSPVRFSDLNFTGADIPKHEHPDMASLARHGHHIDNFSAYKPLLGYAQSKSALIMFSAYLTDHLSKYGILSYGVNPGGIHTDIGRHLPEDVVEQILTSGLLNKTQDTGAAPVMVSAFDPSLNCEAAGTPPYTQENCSPAEPMPWTTDKALAEKLWHVSEELVGDRFDLHSK